MPVQSQANVKSEALREFIGQQPGFLIRKGVMIFFFILVILAIVSWFVQYPDIVNASAKINSINAPKQVVARSGGRLTRLLKEDETPIKRGEVIGYIESTADPVDVLKLSAILDTLQSLATNNHLEEIPEVWEALNQPFPHLGELQQTHQAFMQGYISFKNYLKSGFYITKKKMLQKDLVNNIQLLQNLQLQKTMQEEDLSLAIKNFNVHDTLHNEAILNDLDFRSQQSQLLSKKMGIPQMNASLISNENQHNALSQQILELDNQVMEERAKFIQLINSYTSLVESWKQKYLIVSPIDGKLVFTSFLEENQQIQINQVVAYITNQGNQYYAEMVVPYNNSGKVKIGQEVLLKFQAYPSNEVGNVKGTINYIKSIPTDSGYLAKVTLPMGLVTNYKKNILFTEGLTASVEIITEKKRLSDRFLAGFKELIK